MEIAKGIEMLQLEFQEFVIHPILLWDDEMAVLIDTVSQDKLKIYK